MTTTSQKPRISEGGRHFLDLLRKGKRGEAARLALSYGMTNKEIGELLRTEMERAKKRQNMNLQLAIFELSQLDWGS